MAVNVGEINAKITADTRGFTTGINQASKQAKGFSTGMVANQNQMAAFSNQLAATGAQMNNLAAESAAMSGATTAGTQALATSQAQLQSSANATTALADESHHLK